MGPPAGGGRGRFHRLPGRQRAGPRRRRRASASAPATATSPPPRRPRSRTRTCGSSTSTSPRWTRPSTPASCWSPTRATAWRRSPRRWPATGSTTPTCGRTASSSGPTGTRVVDEAYHLDHQPLPAQTEVLGALNEERRRPRRGRPGRRQHARRPADAVARQGPEAVPRGVRLLLHGLRDRRRARHQDGRAGAGGVRARRRRLLPDDGAGDRHGGLRGRQAGARHRAEPRVRLDRLAVGVSSGRSGSAPYYRYRNDGDRAARRRRSCRSTSPRTPRAWAPT